MCFGCHTGGQSPVVLIDGPSTVVTGDAPQFTFSILGGPAVIGGMNIAIDGDGTLVPSSETRLTNGQLVQLMPKAFSTGSVVWSFTVKVGADAGTGTLYGSGLSANGDGTRAGDNGSMTSFSFTVVPGTPDSGTPDAGSVSPDAGTPTDAGARTGDGGTPHDSGVVTAQPDAGTSPGVDEASFGTGCDVAFGAPLIPLLLLLLARGRRPILYRHVWTTSDIQSKTEA
jgi:hypothetical protein